MSHIKVERIIAYFPYEKGRIAGNNHETHPYIDVMEAPSEWMIQLWDLLCEMSYVCRDNKQTFVFEASNYLVDSGRYVAISFKDGKARWVIWDSEGWVPANLKDWRGEHDFSWEELLTLAPRHAISHGSINPIIGFQIQNMVGVAP